MWGIFVRWRTQSWTSGNKYRCLPLISKQKKQKQKSFTQVFFRVTCADFSFERSTCDFHWTLNLPRIQIVHNWIKQDPPVPFSGRHAQNHFRIYGVPQIRFGLPLRAKHGVWTPRLPNSPNLHDPDGKPRIVPALLWWYHFWKSRSKGRGWEPLTKSWIRP